MNKDMFLKLMAIIITFFALRSLVAVDCEECCKKGRWVSKECCTECNNCEVVGSDESTAECQDVPS
ncbi:MAG: hypothetical protein WDZ41_01490 [Candidatus Babeliales bacterium]